MLVEKIHVQGYRSIRDLTLSLKPITVIVGPNGCGKTNLYRALALLPAAAAGRLALTLAEEGGMPSALWAGVRVRKKPVRLTVGVTFEDLRFELSCGLPAPPAPSAPFSLDPEVKEEGLWFRNSKGKEVCLLERDHAYTWASGEEGTRRAYPGILATAESVLSQLRDPKEFPVLLSLCHELQSWRFYHQFRSDHASPLRQAQTGVRTPILASDGHDLAAALCTIEQSGDGRALDLALQRAFPGSVFRAVWEGVRFAVEMRVPEFQRAFAATEMSDGTLHYLCLAVALLSPQPASLLALNEPETSIHPDLLEPLAELIVQSSHHWRLWITTHSEKLAHLIALQSGHTPVRLTRIDGETRLSRARDAG